MTTVDFTRYVEGIQKTGFVLEHRIAEELRRRHWTVINNKYYIDNEAEVPREVDMVAYRWSGDHPDFDLFTTVIISCKKSDHCTWAFLTRTDQGRSTNMDREPIHIFTSSPAFRFMMNDTKNWAAAYHDAQRAAGVVKLFPKDGHEIFAMQEMLNGKGKDQSKLEGKPSGDSAIFGAMMSLMKAQHYELSVRHKRARTKPAIYQFNLLSIVEGQMIRLHFEGEKIHPSTTTFESHVARYIFNETETFSRIGIVEKAGVPELLDDFERLHSNNMQLFGEMVDNFFTGITDSYPRLCLYEPEFTKDLTREINFLYFMSHRRIGDLKLKDVAYVKATSTLEIAVYGGSQDELNFLNANAVEAAIRLAKQHFKYVGKIEYGEGVPF